MVAWIQIVAANIYPVLEESMAYLNLIFEFQTVLELSKSARSAQTHKSISFIWIVWNTLYVYLWLAWEKIVVTHLSKLHAEKVTPYLIELLMNCWPQGRNFLHSSEVLEKTQMG